MASIPAHIRRLRTARHLTQEQLAERLFVTRQAVSAWETGKAQPDVETLERIAAALDAELTEVLYGAARSPDLRRLRRRWLLTGGGTAGILAVFIFILFIFDVWGTAFGGLSYQFYDLDYELSFTEVPGRYAVTLDLRDPEGSVGAVLYEDETGCRIRVSGVDVSGEDPGAWRVFFLAEGVCRQRGGTLVAGMMERPAGKRSALVGGGASAQLTTTVDGVSRPGAPAGENGLSGNDKAFGYYLFRSSAAAGLPETRPAAVTLTLEGLTRLTTLRR